MSAKGTLYAITWTTLQCTPRIAYWGGTHKCEPVTADHSLGQRRRQTSNSIQFRTMLDVKTPTEELPTKGATPAIRQRDAKRNSTAVGKAPACTQQSKRFQTCGAVNARQPDEPSKEHGELLTKASAPATVKCSATKKSGCGRQRAHRSLVVNSCSLAPTKQLGLGLGLHSGLRTEDFVTSGLQTSTPLFAAWEPKGPAERLREHSLGTVNIRTLSLSPYEVQLTDHSLGTVNSRS